MIQAMDTPTPPEHPVAESSPANAAAAHKAKRRRMLMAAGAAVPTVLTLTSGASVAAASLAPTRFMSAPDKYYRMPVYDAKTKQGNNTVHCVNTPQSKCTDGNGQAPDGSVWVQNDGTRSVAGPFSQVKNVTGSQKTYGLVYVDKKGSIITLDPNGDTSLTYCTTSGMNSIIGAQISKLG